MSVLQVFSLQIVPGPGHFLNYSNSIMTFCDPDPLIRMNPERKSSGVKDQFRTVKSKREQKTSTLFYLHSEID